MIAYADNLNLSIHPLDSESEGYDLQIWESGLLSGLGFVLRRSNLSGVLVHELRGSLASDDIEGVAYATTCAGIIMSKENIPVPTNGQWRIREKTAQ